MQHQSWHPIVGFGLVIIMGLGTFALALETLPERLQAPFGLKSGNTLAKASAILDSTQTLLSQTKDTDRDGLPDAQELQVYKTSPFLEDSDSDGILDKVEIDAGADPNCPKGKDCRALAFPSAREVEQQTLIKKLYESTVTAKLSDIGVPGISDAASIRGFLRTAGISEDILSQFDDQALRKMFEEAAQQSNGDKAELFPNQSSALPAQSQSGSLPKNPTPQEIRELLLRAGMDKALLEKFNDEQIVKLYQETLQEVNQQE